MTGVSVNSVLRGDESHRLAVAGVLPASKRRFWPDRAAYHAQRQAQLQQRLQCHDDVNFDPPSLTYVGARRSPDNQPTTASDVIGSAASPGLKTFPHGTHSHMLRSTVLGNRLIRARIRPDPQSGQRGRIALEYGISGTALFRRSGGSTTLSVTDSSRRRNGDTPTIVQLCPDVDINTRGWPFIWVPEPTVPMPDVASNCVAAIDSIRMRCARWLAGQGSKSGRVCRRSHLFSGSGPQPR